MIYDNNNDSLVILFNINDNELYIIIKNYYELIQK